MRKIKSEVSVGVLKNKLSAYLTTVKAGGIVIVTDHNHPVAKIVPYETRTNELKIIPSKEDPAFLMKIAGSTKERDFQSLEGLIKDRGE